MRINVSKVWEINLCSFETYSDESIWTSDLNDSCYEKNVYAFHTLSLCTQQISYEFP